MTQAHRLDADHFDIEVILMLNFCGASGWRPMQDSRAAMLPFCERLDPLASDITKSDIRAQTWSHLTIPKQC